MRHMSSQRFFMEICIPEYHIQRFREGCVLIEAVYVVLVRVTSKYKSKFNFDRFRKENLMYVFSCCDTREDLSIYVPIITVQLILTKLGGFQHLNTSQNLISTFHRRKIQFLDFHAVVPIREDLSIHVSITTLRLMKL